VAASVAVEAEPSLQPSVGSSIEKRLQRLEKLVESLVAEHQRVPPTAANSSRAAMEYGIIGYPAARIAQNAVNRAYAMRDRAISLSELKKRRIDVEDHLARLQEELAEIDDQIAKVQSARPGNRYRDFDKK
jgi:hypothetical protein